MRTMYWPRYPQANAIRCPPDDPSHQRYPYCRWLSGPTPPPGVHQVCSMTASLDSFRSCFAATPCAAWCVQRPDVKGRTHAEAPRVVVSRRSALRLARRGRLHALPTRLAAAPGGSPGDAAASDGRDRHYRRAPGLLRSRCQVEAWFPFCSCLWPSSVSPDGSLLVDYADTNDGRADPIRGPDLRVIPTFALDRARSAG